MARRPSCASALVRARLAAASRSPWAMPSRGRDRRWMLALMPASESGALSAMRRASACTAAGSSAAGDHLVDHADLVGAPRVDGLAGEQQMARVGGPDDLDQLLAEQERDHEPDARERHAEPHRLRGHPEVAVQRELAAARDRVAVERGDGGMLRALHPAQHLDHVAFRIASPPRCSISLRSMPEQKAGPAPLTTTTRTSRRSSRSSKVARRPCSSARVHRVALIRAVQRHGGDAGIDGQQDFVGHGWSPWARVRGCPRPVASDARARSA